MQGNNTSGFCFQRHTLTVVSRLKRKANEVMKQKWREREREEARIFVIYVRHTKGLNESLAENKDERGIGGYFRDRINRINLM